MSTAPTHEVTFLELGFDSLFLTQVAGAFRKEFGVKVTFRQLAGRFRHDGRRSSAHLDTILPPEVMRPAVVAPAMSVQPMTPAPIASNLGRPESLQASSAVPRSEIVSADSGSSGAVERVIQEQLRVMAQQLRNMCAAEPRLLFCPRLCRVVPPQSVATLPVSEAWRRNRCLPKSSPKRSVPYRPIEKGAGRRIHGTAAVGISMP